MKENPKMLRAFLEASYMGWRDVMDNPKSALEIFKTVAEPEASIEASALAISSISPSAAVAR